MKTYARMVNGQVVEIIPPQVAEEDIFRPGEPLEDGSPGEPVLIFSEGQEIPIEQRFTPDIVGQLIDYDPANPPAPLPPEALTPAPAITEASARAQRDALLRVSDWTQLRDIPDEVAALWAPYRQALRDVPSQSGFPAAIEWPGMPSAGESRVGASRVGTATVGNASTAA